MTDRDGGTIPSDEERTNDERRQKYAAGVLDSYTADQRVDVVIALADAEQAELRAEVERLEADTASMGERLDDAESDARYWHAECESVRRAAETLERSSAHSLGRRTKAEATIARVEAVCADPDFANGHVSVVRVLAALRGPEPTEDVCTNCAGSGMDGTKHFDEQPSEPHQCGYCGGSGRG